MAPVNTNQWDAEEYNLGNYVQRQYAEHILENYTICETADILDIGCGDGEITKWLTFRATKGKTLGIDRSEEMVQHAVKQHSLTENLSFQVYNAMEIDTLGQFDLITSFSCMHWVEDKAKLLMKMHRILNHDGRILLTFPTGDEFVRYGIETVLNHQKWQSKYGEYNSPVHWATQHQLNTWLRRANFIIDALEIAEEFIPLPSIEAYRRFISALPILTHVDDTKDRMMMIDEIAAHFKNHCDDHHDGKLLFPIKCHVIKASK